jgi:tetratricopeptide (TPR) repeat protein
MSTKDLKQLISVQKYYWIIAVIVTFISLYPTVNNTWVNWDDDGYVLHNSLITSLDLDGIVSIFQEPNLVGNYHPLTVLSLAVDYAISGEAPFAYHLHSLLLHLLNVVLVFVLISRLFKSYQMALLVALLFGIHPMHVESVAWISARKDLLYTAYLMMGLLVYLKFIDCTSIAKRRVLFVFSFVLFSCSLLSKGVAMVFPAYLFLIDYLRGRKVNRSSLIAKVPFILLSAGFVFISFYSQQLEGAFITEVDFPFIDRFAIATTSFLVYIFQSIVPIHLSPFHPYPFQQLSDFPTHYYFSLLVIPGLLVFCWMAIRKKWKVALFGILFFTMTLIPVLQLIPLGRAMMAERYTYVAYLGLIILIGFGLVKLMNQNQLKQRISIGVFAIVILIFSSISYTYSKAWENGETLWSKVIEQYPEDYFAHYSRADFYFKQGDWSAALEDVNRSISLSPYFGVAYQLRGQLYEKSKELQLAVNDYEQAIALTPNYGPSYVNLARILGADGQFDAALKYLDQVVILIPTYATAFLNRGVIHEKLGEKEKGRLDYSKAIQLEPNNGLFYRYRGVNYLADGESNAAIADFNKAIQFLPKDGLSYFLRAKALQQIGLKSEALLDAQKAIDLNYPVEQSFINELKE